MMMIPSILTGVCFNENELKMVGFWIHRFFSQRKILMSRISLLIFDFSKETHCKLTGQASTDK